MGVYGILAAARAMAEDQRGNMAAIAGIMMTVFAGSAAVMVDFGRAYALRSDLEATADAAALAAAARLPDVKRARAMAIAYARKNLPVETYGEVLRAEDIVFGAWDPGTRTLDPKKAPNAVRVTARMGKANGNAMPTMLAGVFGVAELEIEHSAMAGRRGAACVFALEPNSKDGMKLWHDAALQAHDCGVQVNSTNKHALDIKNSATLLASSVCVTGSAKYKQGTVSPVPTEGCPPQPDPLADLATPPIGGCAAKPNLTLPGVLTTVGPGTYCGGLHIDNAALVHLLPGTYVFLDGPLEVEGGSSIKGEGVTFFFTGENAVLDIQNGASIKLRAPTDGPLQGMLVFQDPASDGTHTWNSEAASELTGTIYLPNGDFVSESDASITPLRSCNVLIARSISFAKTSGMSIDLSSTECQKLLPAALSRATALLE
jgi:Flp pilus assembly protein TadG